MARSANLNDWSVVPNATMSRAEQLFAELDCQIVGEAADRWVLVVLGIHDFIQGAWVQIAPAHDTSRGLVLQLLPRATADHALAALTAWSKIPPDERPRVVEVRPTDL